jgi:hypothetical protein
MQIDIWGLALLLIGVIVGALGQYVRMWVIEKFRAQDKRIHDLEEILAGKRHTENTTAALEDIGLMQTGAVYRIQATLQQTLDTLEYLEYAATKTAQAAGQARKGPRAYPVDAPSGPRGKPLSSP